MTTQADYTDEEWVVLRRAPLVAGLAVSLADPGGPIELTKETLAAMKVARTPPSQDELLLAVSKDLDTEVRTHGKPLEDLEIRGRTARKQVVEELGKVNAILTAKATPEEAASFRVWLVQAAEGAAEAAKEGGFLGVGRVRVSKGEQAMIDRIREILGVPGD
jgi:hypothetical protein